MQVFTAPNLYRYSWEEPVNEALKHATGEYFTILGADDFITDDYIENIAKIISSAPDKIKVLQSPIRGIRETIDNPMGELRHDYKSMQELKQLLFLSALLLLPRLFIRNNFTTRELYGGIQKIT